jgi:hypothetical protein
LVASLLLWRSALGRARNVILAEMGLVVLMMLATIYVQHGIIPAMERDRASVGGDIAAASAKNATRVDFDRLHALSEKVEGSALFLGLGVVVLMGLEGGIGHDRQVTR